MNSFNEDTIVALATVMGQSAIGVIRLSGPQSINIGDALFVGKKKLNQLKGYSIAFGQIVDEQKQVVDEVLVTVFKAPNSYTGEDAIEISTHGSIHVIQEVIKLCLRAGARWAQAGEFTQRAFLHGKLDLAQAEAVADVIHAESAAAHKAAMHQMRGGFSGELNAMRNELINFTALIELELDFAEEDVEFADRSQLNALIEKLLQQSRSLIDSFQLGNVMKNGVRVAIIGKPNAGKSTLLNGLLKEERAIVSEIPGTTRDTIEETLNINGLSFRLIDTAGIRAESRDAIENIGIERSKKSAAGADVVIHLKDITDEQPDEEIEKWLAQQKVKVLTLYNKKDLYAQMQMATPKLQLKAGSISARNQEDLHEVKQQLYQLAMPMQHTADQVVVTSMRHVAALKEIEQSLLLIRNGMNQGLSGDLLTVDIRRALHYLGVITGQVEVDRDILGTIFGKFCIGK